MPAAVAENFHRNGRPVRRRNGAAMLLCRGGAAWERPAHAARVRPQSLRWKASRGGRAAPSKGWFQAWNTLKEASARYMHYPSETRQRARTPETNATV
jgi:hypothetical protein